MPSWTLEDLTTSILVNKIQFVFVILNTEKGVRGIVVSRKKSISLSGYRIDFVSYF